MHVDLSRPRRKSGGELNIALQKSRVVISQLKFAVVFALELLIGIYALDKHLQRIACRYELGSRCRSRLWLVGLYPDRLRFGHPVQNRPAVSHFAGFQIVVPGAGCIVIYSGYVDL